MQGSKPLSAPQKALRKLGLARDIDLALHLPLRYEDETRLTRLREARETVRVGDWVRIEELATPEDAANALAQLQAAGATDAAVLGADEGAGNVVSLGVFTEPRRAAEAATIAEAHRQMGVYFAMFDVNVTTVKPTVPMAWIVSAPAASMRRRSHCL
jgi:hypothetical protein